MICVAAAIVFGILALFSAKYRSLAREAWGCVFRKVTLRPCQSGLDRRMRMGATLAFSKRSPALGRAVYKAFPFLSFLLVATTIISFVYLAWGGYNYALYGNCNGPGSTGFCVFDPNGAGSSGVEQCSETPRDPSAIVIPNASAITGFKTFNPQGTKTVVFIGCYSCPYTREGATALLDAIGARPNVRFVLVDFPLLQHNGSMEAAVAGNCVYDKDPAAYVSYARELYTADFANGMPAYPSGMACENVTPSPRVMQGQDLGASMGVYGTPTYIIGGKAYVGPLNSRALLTLIDRAPTD